MIDYPDAAEELVPAICPSCGCYANIDWGIDKDGSVVGPVCEEFPGCADLMEPPQ